jgi:putative peptide zinc metalloprotease protein
MVADGGLSHDSMSFSLPRLRPSVTIVKQRDGEFTVRDDVQRQYFTAAAEEAYLLQQLRQGAKWPELQVEYKRQFNDAVAREDIRDFVQLLEDRHLVEDTAGFDELGIKRNPTSPAPSHRLGRGKGSLLFYRVPLCDPDRVLHWFVKLFPFFWTRMFFILSVTLMLVALCVTCVNWGGLGQTFYGVLNLNSGLIALGVVLASTALHEIAHGATCKRHGGQVHEAGFLFMFFLPCMYINVSDAWMIPDRRKRMQITIAGGFSDLLNWAFGVLVWRMTVRGTLVNEMAFVLAAACGTRGLLNLNPLLRMDGYYLLTDWLKYPNLYTTARKYWIEQINWRLWGAAKPIQPQRPRLVLSYGISTWLFAVLSLNVIGLQLIQLADSQLGTSGAILVSVVFLYILRRVFKGFVSSEVAMMIRKRIGRAIFWVGLIALFFILAFTIPMNHYATGDFEVRAAQRIEVSSPLHGFISVVYVQDGQPVQKGDLLFELHAPELATEIAAKSAEFDQSSAILSKLETGARPEEIRALEQRVDMLKSWCHLGEGDVKTAQSALDFQLNSIKQRCEQVQLQISLAERVLKKSKELQAKGGVTGAQVIKEESDLLILKSQLLEYESLYNSRKTEGVRSQIAELTKRQQQLAEAESACLLLKLGSRDEEICAERAKCTRLTEQLEFLRSQQAKLQVRSPSTGIVSAPRIQETLGHFAPQGSLLCRIDEPGVPRVEVFVNEQDASAVQHGQQVFVKARSLPFETFIGVVERVSPAATKPPGSVADQQSVAAPQTVVVHCSIVGAENKLKSGMTGFGRIARGKNTIGSIALTKVYRYIRTEFWW